MFNTSLPNRRLIGEGKSIEHRQVIRACEVAHTLNTLLRERSYDAGSFDGQREIIDSIFN